MNPGASYAWRARAVTFSVFFLDFLAISSSFSPLVINDHLEVAIAWLFDRDGKIVASVTIEISDTSDPLICDITLIDEHVVPAWRSGLSITKTSETIIVEYESVCVLSAVGDDDVLGTIAVDVACEIKASAE